MDQTASGAKPLRIFAKIALALGIVSVAFSSGLVHYEVMSNLQALIFGLPLLLFLLFIYFLCAGFATIVENAAIQKALTMDKSEKEGLIIYDSQD
ncbi:MAG: hypothetical protein CVT98_07910 [Bacteroidetes bacterium HGW-Bacteroidetes-15]|nr:MAG: hypothetical protein CVT98_07910 [Bacteroidetes bacterium HGW-Bacteroidetes-15]